jgi:small-conductance mechanosensitive channel
MWRRQKAVQDRILEQLESTAVPPMVAVGAPVGAVVIGIVAVGVSLQVAVAQLAGFNQRQLAPLLFGWIAFGIVFLFGGSFVSLWTAWYFFTGGGRREHRPRQPRSMRREVAVALSTLLIAGVAAVGVVPFERSLVSLGFAALAGGLAGSGFYRLARLLVYHARSRRLA